MTAKSSSVPRILVAIATYGTSNDAYLAQLLNEYRAMPFETHIVLLSNIDRSQALPGTETFVVDLRGKDPWSLPFPHKQIFADRVNEYDLFIYSENDTPLTERNIRAFLEISEALPENEIAGFVRYEEAPDGSVNYPDIHGHFHWDPQTVRSRGKEIFAHLTNQHSACYVLTRRQLKRAIDSGGFLVEPHQGVYDLLCSAATDPYTQCGFEKLICISRLDDFLVHHLPNKYVGTKLGGVDDSELRRLVNSLLRIGQNGHRPTTLFATETKLKNAWFSKDYYEPANQEIISLIPPQVRTVLSIGCGWGATEGALAEKGLRVTAVPIDPVILAEAKANGVEIVDGDFEAARAKLHGRTFDCLFLSNVLHLVREPDRILSSFCNLLPVGGIVIFSVPNVRALWVMKRIVRGDERFKLVGDFDATGAHATSRGVVRRWCEKSGLKDSRILNALPQRAKLVEGVPFGALTSPLATELVVLAKRE